MRPAETSGGDDNELREWAASAELGDLTTFSVGKNRRKYLHQVCYALSCYALSGSQNEWELSHSSHDARSGGRRPTVVQKFLKQRSPNYADDSLPLAKHRCTSPMDSPGHVLGGGSHWKWKLMPPGQFPTYIFNKTCREPSEMERPFLTPAENRWKPSPRPHGQLLSYFLIKTSLENH